MGLTRPALWGHCLRQWDSQQVMRAPPPTERAVASCQPHGTEGTTAHVAEWQENSRFFCQQFITRGSLAVCRRHIQTLNTLRLHYTVPIMYYQNLGASFWRATTNTRPVASSKTTSPFQVVNAGASQLAAEIAMSIPGLPSERSPDWNPPQRVGQSPEGVKPL
jgi:hypothetical protein